MNNYIEINIDDAILDYEKQMLSEVNIPSLLPVNIINNSENNSVCFITTGYLTVSQLQIQNLETLCQIIKSFVKSVIVSEQYLLMGGKHFIDTDMVFYDAAAKEIKLVFGRINDEECRYADTHVVIEFIDELKKIVNDNVHLHILERIQDGIRGKNTDIKKICIMVEELERKWYCRNLIPEISFENEREQRESQLN